MDPIGSKVIEYRGQRSNLCVFFSFGHVFCLICLHRRNHLTATSRRVKFTSSILFVLNLGYTCKDKLSFVKIFKTIQKI